MKRTHFKLYIFLIVLLFSFYSCSEDKEYTSEIISINQEDLNILSSLGLDMSTLVDEGNSYVLEGCYIFQKDDLTKYKSQEGVELRHARNTFVVSPTNVRSITVGIDKSIPLDNNSTGEDWRQAIFWAINDWNNLSDTSIKLIYSTATNPDIMFSYYSGFTDYTVIAMATFPSSGKPGNKILIGHDKSNLPFSMKRNTVVHEIGHCLGFMHTDVEIPSGSMHYGYIEGTPIPSSTNAEPDKLSVMNQYLRNEWTGFSYYDKVAITSTYPVSDYNYEIVQVSSSYPKYDFEVKDVDNIRGGATVTWSIGYRNNSAPHPNLITTGNRCTVNNYTGYTGGYILTAKVTPTLHPERVFTVKKEILIREKRYENINANFEIVTDDPNYHYYANNQGQQVFRIKDIEKVEGGATVTWSTGYNNNSAPHPHLFQNTPQVNQCIVKNYYNWIANDYILTATIVPKNSGQTIYLRKEIGLFSSTYSYDIKGTLIRPTGKTEPIVFSKTVKYLRSSLNQNMYIDFTNLPSGINVKVFSATGHKNWHFNPLTKRLRIRTEKDGYYMFGFDHPNLENHKLLVQ